MNSWTLLLLGNFWNQSHVQHKDASSEFLAYYSDFTVIQASLLHKSHTESKYKFLEHINNNLQGPS